MYIAKFWKRPDCHIDFELVAEKRFGTEFAARIWANRQLKDCTVVTTRDNYHRDMGRAASVSIYRGEEYIETVLPDYELVPSVGELGYW